MSDDVSALWNAILQPSPLQAPLQQLQYYRPPAPLSLAPVQPQQTSQPKPYSPPRNNKIPDAPPLPSIPVAPLQLAKMPQPAPISPLPDQPPPAMPPPPPRSVLEPATLPTRAPTSLGRQSGARMPVDARDHELALASAAHLRRM